VPAETFRRVKRFAVEDGHNANFDRRGELNVAGPTVYPAGRGKERKVREVGFGLAEKEHPMFGRTVVVLGEHGKDQ